MEPDGGRSLFLPGHDCSIRLWNMESKTCIQEFTAHRKKFEESIHDVAFHPTKCYIGSAGADALAKVFVWPEGAGSRLSSSEDEQRGERVESGWESWNLKVTQTRTAPLRFVKYSSRPPPRTSDLGWPGSRNKQTFGWDDEQEVAKNKIQTSRYIYLQLESFFFLSCSSAGETAPPLTPNSPVSSRSLSSIVHDNVPFFFATEILFGVGQKTY